MQYNIDVEIYTCIKIIMENEREKEKRFQVYHNHRSSGSHGVVPFLAETGRAVYYRHSYRWRVQALGRGECEQMDDRKQRAVCRKVVENDGWKYISKGAFQWRSGRAALYYFPGISHAVSFELGIWGVLRQAEKRHASLGDTCPRESFIMFQNLK